MRYLCRTFRDKDWHLKVQDSRGALAARVPCDRAARGVHDSRRPGVVK